jgi:membrane-associated phospholipid phosphatase
VRRDVVLIVGFLGAFAALTAALAVDGWLIDLDLAVREWSEQRRPPAADIAARWFNLLGQGSPLLGLSLLAAAWLTWRTGSLRPLLHVVAAAVLVVPTVLLIKYVTERGAPSSTLPPEQVVALMGPLPAGEYAAGYPSGHVVNTVVWYGVLLLLLTGLLRAYGRGEPPPAVRVAIRVAPVAIVLAASTYLSFHWLTDGLAGLALGLAIDRALHLIRRHALGWHP